MELVRTRAGRPLLLVLAIGLALLFGPLATGARAAGPEAVITPSAFWFGNQVIGSVSQSAQFLVENPGTTPIKLGVLELERRDDLGGDAFRPGVDECDDVELQPGQSCRLSATFTPSENGLYGARISFPTTRGTVSVAELDGFGVTAKEARLDPEEISFGPVPAGGAPVTQELHIEGLDGHMLESVRGTFAFPDADFTLDESQCIGSQQKPECTMFVTFAPVNPGDRIVLLEVRAGANPLLVPIIGIGVSATGILVEPDAIDFRGQPVGGPMNSRSVIVDHPASVPGAPMIEAARLEDRADPASRDFTILDDGCEGKTLGPDGTCAIEVGFQPTSAGPTSAELEIPTANGTERVLLEGTGEIESELKLVSGETDFEAIVGEPATTSTLVLESTGVSPATIRAVEVEGDGEGFAVAGGDCAGAVLAVGETCEVTVAFSPAAGGATGANLLLRTDGEPGTKAVPLTGTGILLGYLQGEDDSLDFGHRKIGAGETVKVPLANASEVLEPPVTVEEAIIAGADQEDFQASPGTCGTVALGERCEAEVTFDPKSIGAKSATLEIVDDGRFSPIIVPLSGTGDPDPGIAVAPASVDFGTHAVGGGVTDTVVVESDGATPLDVESVTVEGAGKSSFALGPDACLAAPIAPGAKCEFAVSFAPAAAGEQSAELTIASDVGTQPTTVPLSGIGVGVATAEDNAPAPAPAPPNCVPTSVLKLAPYKVTTKRKPGVPGVRARFTTGAPALLEVGASLGYRFRGHTHTVNLGSRRLRVTTTFVNFKVPLPPSLRQRLPTGSPVTMRMTYRLLAPSCSDPTPATKSLATEVVRIAR